MEEVTSNVEAIEVEAEKLLQEARSKADEILLKAKEEARKILSSELPMGEAEAERENIVHKAREEADKKVQDSRRHAAEIRTNAGKKTKEFVSSIVAIITGAKS